MTVLGCDGSYAGAGGACSGYLVQHEDANIWIDCGPGTMANLQRHVALEDVTAIVVSHSHPDHWVELPVLANAFRYYIGRDGIPLFTTTEVIDCLTKVRNTAVETTFSPTVITDDSRFEIQGVSFRTSATDHPVETMAMRVDAGGRSFTYSSDTGPGWEVAVLGNVDLALLEATLQGPRVNSSPHLTTTEAGTHAREAGIGRLVITHLAPGTDAAISAAETADAYGDEVLVAYPNHTFEV